MLRLACFVSGAAVAALRPGVCGPATLLGSIAALAAISTGARAQTGWTVVSLDPGSLVAPDGSQAFGVWGDTQVGAIRAEVTRAVIWSGTAASMVDLHPPGASSSSIDAVWEDTKAGRAYWPGSFYPHAVTWSGGGHVFSDLHPPGASGSVASAVHGDLVVGQWSPSSSSGRAARWSGAGFLELHGPESRALGAASGMAVGYYEVGGYSFAALWNAATGDFVSLHPPRAEASTAYATTGDMHAGWVWLAPHGGGRAALWPGASSSSISLHPSPAIAYSECRALHGGVQAGKTWNGPGSWQRAAFWAGSAASYVDLHALLPPSFYLSEATGVYVHPTGRITVVGWGRADELGAQRHEALMWVREAPCPADCDASGALDFFDFLCFQNLFAAGDPRADCDESGILDFFDFLCFQNAFAAGCP